MDQVFRLDIEENPDHDETEDIILHGDGDEELIQGEGEAVVREGHLRDQ